jgi:hypothetical protein
MDRRNDCNSYMMIEALRCHLLQEEKYIALGSYCGTL